MSDIDKQAAWIMGVLVAIIVTIITLMAIFPPKHSSGNSHGCVPIRSGKVTTVVCH